MTEQRRNKALLAAWIMTVVALASNFPLLFVQFAGQEILAWAGLVLCAVTLALSLMAMRRAYGEGEVYSGRVSSAIVTVLSLLLVAFTVFGFYQARKIPAAAEAPREGQKAPEFVLADTGSNPVSLASLIDTPLAHSPRPDGKPKAVLLVFYRGYW